MPWDLIADIGGTNMRLAAGRKGVVFKQQKFSQLAKFHWRMP